MANDAFSAAGNAPAFTDCVSSMPQPSSRPIGIFLIALFKLIKGALFVLLAISALKLLDRDIADIFWVWITRLHIDIENRFVQNIFMRLDLIDNRMLEEISAVTVVMAGLFFTEGLGLLFQKRWAEYLAVFETGLFIPLEIYEFVRHTTVTKISLLGINIAVVMYLLYVLIRKSSVKTSPLPG
jgi:uncharacterized membrane protein (DUF2068 family)